MSAEKSCEQSMKAIDKMHDIRLATCRRSIKKAIAEGRFSTTCYSLGDAREALLAQEGYKVTPKNSPNADPLMTACKVSWFRSLK